METKAIVAEAMENHQPEVCWIEIEKAENGFVVEYSEKEKKEHGDMTHCDYIKKTHVFNSEEEDKAWEMFIDLKKREFKSKSKKVY
jgi:hypothetical protein